MFMRVISGAVVGALLTTAACGKESKPATGDNQKDQPRTPEELGQVVVDENGSTTPVEKGDTAETAPIVEGSTPCSDKHCFSIGRWSLDFGQTYVQKQPDPVIGRFNGKDEVRTPPMWMLQLDGFENPDLNRKQENCLSETANALRTYANANPEAMDAFAKAGVSTTFAARVYDTSKSLNKVAANLYFIKGSDGEKGGVSLSRGKWVLRSAITGEKNADECQILTPNQIGEKLEYWKSQLLK